MYYILQKPKWREGVEASSSFFFLSSSFLTSFASYHDLHPSNLLFNSSLLVLAFSSFYSIQAKKWRWTSETAPFIPFSSQSRSNTLLSLIVPFFLFKNTSYLFFQSLRGHHTDLHDLEPQPFFVFSFLFFLGEGGGVPMDREYMSVDFFSFFLFFKKVEPPDSHPLVATQGSRNTTLLQRTRPRGFGPPPALLSARLEDMTTLYDYSGLIRAATLNKLIFGNLWKPPFWMN